MQKITRSELNGIQYVAIQTNNTNYLLSFNPNANSSHLFEGYDLFQKFQDLLNSKFDGCIECQLSLFISRAISKEAGIITELGITKEEAKSIINIINYALKSDFPLF